MATIAELLNTEDVNQQVEIVQSLMSRVQAPIVTMTVILNTGDGNTDLMLNGTYSFEEIYTLLDITRREVMRRERAALMEQEKKQD